MCNNFLPDSTFDPGPPDEISAQLTISISGVNPAAGQLTSVPIQAIVGLARLHVPRALQVSGKIKLIREHLIERFSPQSVDTCRRGSVPFPLQAFFLGGQGFNHTQYIIRFSLNPPFILSANVPLLIF